MKTCTSFVRGIFLGMVFFSSLFFVTENAAAQGTSCPSPETNCKAECTNQVTACASACANQGSNLYYCPSGSSTCNASYCKSACDMNTDDTTQTACNSVCKTPGLSQYCPPKGSSPPDGTTGPGATNVIDISLPNPLKYNTVQEVVMALLYALQGIIVILSLVFIVEFKLFCFSCLAFHTHNC